MRHVMNHIRDSNCRVIVEPVHENQYRVTYMKKRTGNIIIEYWPANKVENNFTETIKSREKNNGN